jgi:hypothetical protein
MHYQKGIGSLIEKLDPISNIDLRFSSEYVSPEGFECFGTHRMPTNSSSSFKTSSNTSKSIPSLFKELAQPQFQNLQAS